MTEEQLDRVHEAKERLHDQIHQLVNEETAELDGEESELLRVQLQEEFRFWSTVL